MNCPSCGKTLSAPDTAAGKQAKCPACGQIMVVPEIVHEAEDIYAPEPEPSTPFSSQPPAGSTENWLDGVQGPAPQPTATGPGGEARRPCPRCGEMIVVGAAKCRFCNTIFDPRLRGNLAKKTDDETLNGVEWFICIVPICLLGCIVGIVYAIQGKPKGMKMVGISFAAIVAWNVLSGIIQFMLMQGQHHFR
jgi:predicted RNA-binding Zn-ribbon protein involved in translation (DUF1610 family)